MPDGARQLSATVILNFRAGETRTGSNCMSG